MAGRKRLVGSLVAGGVLLLASAGQAQNVTVYSDALAAGWSDYSYPDPGIVVSFANVAPVHSGAASVAVTFNGPFAALSLRTATPLDGAAYSAIRFWIYGGAGGTSLDAFTQATDGGAGSPVYSFTGPAGVWTQIVIPLSALGDPAAIARINLQDNTNTSQPTFYVDDVEVVAAAVVSGARDAIADRVVGQAAFNAAGPGTTATTLNGPAAVAVGPDGRLFVADYENSRVLGWPNAHAFTSGAPATLVLGQANFTSGGAGSAVNRLDHPEGVTVDPSGNVFVADTANHRIMVFSPPLSNGMARTLGFGSADPGLAGGNCTAQPLNNLFCYPRALASDSQGNIYLGDEFHDRVLIYQTPMTTDTLPDKQLTGLTGTRGVAVDPSGTVYASDSENDVVREYDTPLVGDTTPDRTFGSGSDGLDCFNSGVAAPTATSLACPIDLATDAAGNLYVADLYHNRVLGYTNPLADNVPDMVFGQHGSFTTGTANNGGLSAESIRTPLGLAVDAGGSLYLADFDNNRVLAYDLDQDLIFANGFQSGDLSGWSSAQIDGGDLAVGAAAGLHGTSLGLQAVVNDTAGVFVTDDTPNNEDRYRARFYFDPNGFDPGEAQGHLRTRIFIAFEEAPNRRLAAIVLRRMGGAYSLLGRARRDDNSQANTGFFSITDAPHAVEIDWKRSSGPGANDGSFQMWIDGVSVSTLSGLDNDLSSVDFVRLGALSVKTGATGTLYWDEFQSRRQTYTGP